MVNSSYKVVLVGKRGPGSAWDARRGITDEQQLWSRETGTGQNALGSVGADAMTAAGLLHEQGCPLMSSPTNSIQLALLVLEHIVGAKT